MKKISYIWDLSLLFCKSKIALRCLNVVFCFLSVWWTFSHVCILYKWLCFVYFTAQYILEYISTVPLFEAQDVWKHV